MKTTKSAMLVSAVGAGLFLLCALALYVAFYHVFPQPFFQEPPIDVRTKIQDIKDIEHLRNMALLLDSNTRSSLSIFSDLLMSAVRLIIVLNIIAGAMFLVNLGNWMKLKREQNSEPVPWWLRWL
ncbi:MAG: hypothetical protein ABL902_04860 [Gallionella sp.]